MDRIEFLNRYSELVKLVINRVKKTIENGLLSLEEDLDLEKVYNRDILEYGLMLVSNGYDEDYIGEILSNIIKEEKDEYTRLLKEIQSEAACCLCRGYGVVQTYYILNSYTDLSFNDDPVKEFVAEAASYKYVKERNETFLMDYLHKK